ncbi:MAG: ATP-binding protein [Oscillospiraceae bacterium]|nr:ATP-binding protein [Oscillospiraceae bacterium]
MIKRIFSIFFICVFLITALSGCLVFQTPPQVAQHNINPFESFRDVPEITEQEIAAIEALQRERTSFSYAMILSTEAFVTKSGEFGGYAALFCEWLTQLFDIPFEIEIFPMNVLLEKLAAHELDFSGVVMTTPENLDRFYMTEIIAERQFVTLRLAGSRELSQIAAERPIKYIFVANTPSEPSVAAVTQPGTYEPVFVSNAMEAYQVLKNGEADAFIMSNNNDALFVEYDDVIIEDFFPLIFNPVSMATANSELAPIISVVKKAQQNNANIYLSHLHAQSYQDYSKHKLFARLTDEERDFISNAGKIPIAVQNTNYPLSFFDERSNHWHGMFFDLLFGISMLTGLDFEVAHSENATWAELNELLISGKAAFAPQVGWTKEREEHYIWSDIVLYSDNYALISHSAFRNIVLNDIINLQVGLAQGTSFADIFIQWFPNHKNITFYDTQDLAFEGLKNGEVDLVMSTQKRLLQLTHYQELPHFKANYIFDQHTEVRFGFNKNETILLSIIDKSLSLLDKDRIVGHWMEKTFDFRAKIAEERQPWFISTLIAFAVVFALLAVLYIRNQKIADQKARESEENKLQLVKFDLVVNSAKIGLWDLEILRNDPFAPSNPNIYSDEFRHLLGYTDENDFPNILSSWADLLHADDKRRVFDAFVAHLYDKTGKTPFNEEYRLLKKDGTYAHFFASCETVRDEDGEPLRACGSLTDITLAKETAERAMLMLDTSPLCSQIWDKNLNTIDCNEAALRMYGFRDKQEYSERFITSCSPEFQPDGQRSDEKAIKLVNTAFEEGFCMFDWVHKMPDDDRLIPSEVYLVRTKYGDNDVVVGYTRDMRDHNMMMDELLEKSRLLETALIKAETASQAKSDFLANMSHEMRTPLNAIIGMTLIGRRTDNPEEKTQAFNKIDDASSHLLGVVGDILDMAKIETDNLVLFPVEFHFMHMVERVLNVVHFSATEKKHKLSKRIDKSIPTFLFGDDQRLAQVIANLLANAIKFTPEGGDIKLNIDLVSLIEDDCELKVEVIDNGIGIPLEQQEKLFNAFEQLETSTTREYGGIGLGLAISKRTVELMNGEIWVESEINEGAKIIFTVHIQKGQKNDLPDGDDDGAGENDESLFKGRKLLVVEDIEINREIVIALLDGSGLEIDCAENGKEAFDIISANPDKYDLVFMDLQMPYMDGLTATKLIRELPDERFKTLPIVAMTANVFKDDIDACIEAGMNDHLGKPLDYDKVLEILRKNLSNFTPPPA